jgi:hypothetical protein
MDALVELPVEREPETDLRKVRGHIQIALSQLDRNWLIGSIDCVDKRRVVETQERLEVNICEDIFVRRRIVKR